MYKAIDIAKWVIFLFNQNETEITNLKLQKILYYIQLAFIKKINKAAFNDEMQAWRHGPVIPNVYKVYSHFVTDPIVQNSKDLIDIPLQYMKIIEDVVIKNLHISTWELVAESKMEEPWKNKYIPSFNNVILIEDIEKSINK